MLQVGTLYAYCNIAFFFIYANMNGILFPPHQIHLFNSQAQTKMMWHVSGMMQMPQ